MVCILKVRYFFDGYILNEKLRKKVFYVWKFILYGCGFFIKGMRYIVGDGFLVNIYVDRFMDFWLFIKVITSLWRFLSKRKGEWVFWYY